LSLQKSFGNNTPFITTGNLKGGHAKSVIVPRLSMARFNDSKSLAGFVAAFGTLILLSLFLSPEEFEAECSLM
jgi:hypothetical protein